MNRRHRENLKEQLDDIYAHYQTNRDKAFYRLCAIVKILIDELGDKNQK